MSACPPNSGAKADCQELTLVRRAVPTPASARSLGCCRSACPLASLGVYDFYDKRCVLVPTRDWRVTVETPTEKRGRLHADRLGKPRSCQYQSAPRSPFWNRIMS